jgi:hypothetical protein
LWGADDCQAQGGEPPKLPASAFLVSTTGPYIGSPSAVYDAFRRGLRELGYVEGGT